jgi:hypothetical protein
MRFVLPFLALFAASGLDAQQALPEKCRQHVEKFLAYELVVTVSNAEGEATERGDIFNVIRTGQVISILWTRYADQYFNPGIEADKQCYQGILNSQADDTMNRIRTILVRASGG